MAQTHAWQTCFKFDIGFWTNLLVFFKDKVFKAIDKVFDAYFKLDCCEKPTDGWLVSWQGACEKHPALIQMFVEALCELGEVVVDITNSACGFINLSSICMFQ